MALFSIIYCCSSTGTKIRTQNHEYCSYKTKMQANQCSRCTLIGLRTRPSLQVFQTRTYTGTFTCTGYEHVPEPPTQTYRVRTFTFLPYMLAPVRVCFGSAVTCIWRELGCVVAARLRGCAKEPPTQNPAHLSGNRGCVGSVLFGKTHKWSASVIYYCSHLAIEIEVGLTKVRFPTAVATSESFRSRTSYCSYGGLNKSSCPCAFQHRSFSGGGSYCLQ